MKLFYFTSTGNSLSIAKKFGGELYSIPSLLKNGTPIEYTDDCIGIISPCYYLGVPRIVKRFIQKATLNSEYIFAIMSYGNFSGGGINQFFSLCEKNGISLTYLNEIYMINNYLPLFDMKQQLEKKSSETIEKNIDTIVEDISKRKTYIAHKNLIQSFLTTIAIIYYAIHIKKADSRLKVEEMCNGCGTCAQVCPVGNIRVEGRPQFLGNCEECLGCAHHCPQNAIRVKGEKSRHRFLNSTVQVKEIIESNYTPPH